jgi:hypothetical protein
VVRRLDVVGEVGVRRRAHDEERRVDRERERREPGHRTPPQVRHRAIIARARGALGVYPREDDDELELLDPPPPPPPDDDELELLEELEPPPPPPPEDELELLEELEDGVDDDELDDEVLEVLGAGDAEELLDGVGEGEELDSPDGELGPLLSHPIDAASPIVIAPPLRRRRKSRRSARVFRTTVSSIFRSLWSAMAA